MALETTMPGQTTKLEQLKDRVNAGQPFVGPLENDRGKEWLPRLKRAEDVYKEQSADWDDLRALVAKPYSIITFEDGTQVHIKLPIASSIVKNHVADLYFKNPEPLIRSRQAREDQQFDRMLCDLARGLHDIAGTESVTRKCLYTGAYQGGGVSWISFEQDGSWQTVPQLDQSGAQTVDQDSGAPQFDYEFNATAQRVRDEFVALSNMRFDPDGRDWDLSDHKYVIRLYKRTLKEASEDTEHYTADGIQYLVNAMSGSDSRRGIVDGARSQPAETDPAHITCRFAEIWDKATFTILHVPLINGEYASFDMRCGDDAAAWPEAFQRMKKYPARLIAENWIGPDIEEKEGFYPVPLLRYVRALVEDLIRLYSLFFKAAESVIRKYLTIEGVFAKGAFVNLLRGDEADMVELKREDLVQALGSSDLTNVDLRRLVTLLDSPQEQIKALNFAEMIDRVYEQIWQITGQGPGDRGGVSEAGSATEAANIRLAMDKRTADAVEELGKAFDDRTETLFMLVSEYQTLPIPYQKTVGDYDERVWSEFNADLLYGLEVSYSHVTDSSRPRNKATERIERKEAYGVMAPFISSKRQLDKLGVWLASSYDYPNPKDLIEDPAPDIAKDIILHLIVPIKQGQLSPADPRVGNALMEGLSTLCAAVLSDKDKEEIANAMGGGSAPDGGPGNGGSAPRPSSKSAGQIAAGSAAAGQTNIL